MHNSFCNFPEKCFKLLRSFFRSNLETPSLSHSAPWDPMFIISKLAFFVSHTYSTWNQLSPRSLCFLCRPMQWWLFFFLSWCDIQPSYPLLSPTPPALNLSHHQGLLKWVSFSHQVAKVLEFHQSFEVIIFFSYLSLPRIRSGMDRYPPCFSLQLDHVSFSELQLLIFFFFNFILFYLFIFFYL